MIRVLAKRVGERPRVVEIDADSLQAMYELTNGGPIELLRNFGGTGLDLVLNEEGKLRDLLPHLLNGRHDVVVGDVFVARPDHETGDFVGLSESDTSAAYVALTVFDVSRDDA